MKWFPQETLVWTPPRPLFSRYLAAPPRSTRLWKSITPVELIMKGDKMGSSEAALHGKLGIRSSYGLVITNVYDGGPVFSPKVLDETNLDLIKKYDTGVSMVASLPLALSYPTLAGAPHMFINGYKNVLAVAVETTY